MSILWRVSLSCFLSPVGPGHWTLSRPPASKDWGAVALPKMFKNTFWWNTHTKQTKQTWTYELKQLFEAKHIFGISKSGHNWAQLGTTGQPWGVNKGPMICSRWKIDAISSARLSEAPRIAQQGQNNLGPAQKNTTYIYMQLSYHVYLPP